MKVGIRGLLPISVCVFSLFFGIADAKAVNKCTRYLGAPAGIWNGNCPPPSRFDSITTSVYASTSSTGLRDSNHMEIEPGSSVCVPTRLHLWYRNTAGAIAGNTTSYGCGVRVWHWYSGSPGYYYSRCNLVNDNGSYVQRFAQCFTPWHT